MGQAWDASGREVVTKYLFSGGGWGACRQKELKSVLQNVPFAGNHREL